MNRGQGGQTLGGSFKYEFRNRDDPRFADRRMQSLLRVIYESIGKASPAETSQLCKCCLLTYAIRYSAQSRQT